MNSIGLPYFILLLAIAYLSVVYGVLKIAQKPRRNSITSNQTSLKSDQGVETS